MTMLIVGIVLGTLVGIGMIVGKRQCPHCRSNIDVKATTCPRCQKEIVDDEFSKHDLKKRNTNYAVAGLLIGLFLVGYIVVNSKGQSASSAKKTGSVRKSTQVQQEQKSRCVVSSVDTKITEQNSVWWKFAWKATIKNNTDNSISTGVLVKFLDKDGFVVDEDREYGVVVPANSEKTISEFALIDVSVAGNVKTVQAVAE